MLHQENKLYDNISLQPSAVMALSPVYRNELAIEIMITAIDSSSDHNVYGNIDFLLQQMEF